MTTWRDGSGIVICAEEKGLAALSAWSRTELYSRPFRCLQIDTVACGKGHEKAKVNLGVALYTGTGCEKDVDKAEELWREAHEAGISQAGFCLRNMEKSPGKLEQMFE